MGLFIAHLYTSVVFIKRLFTQKSYTKLTLAGFFFLIIALFFLLIFFIFRNLFFYLSTFDQLSLPIIIYIFNSSFALTLLLILGSGLINTSIHLYQDKKLDFIFSLPFSIQTIFSFQYLKELIYNLWPLIILAIPILLSYFSVFSLSLINNIYALICLFVFALFAHNLSLLLAMLLFTQLKKIPRWILLILIILGLVLFAYSFINFLFPTNLWQIYQAKNLDSFINQLKQLPIYSNILPSSLFTSAIIESSFSSFILLLIQTLILSILNLSLAQRFYLENWQMLHEEKKVVANISEKPQLLSNKPTVFLNKKGIFLLLTKDLVKYQRSGSEIAYTLFIAFIALTLLFLIVRIPNLHKTAKFFPQFITFIFLAIEYIVIIISMRFIFPLVSLEGKSAWIIFTAPNINKIFFWGKVIYSTIFLTLINILLMAVAVLLLHLSFLESLFVVLTAAIIGVGIAIISFSLGSIFPNFVGLDVEKIVTTPVGVLTTIILIFYSFVGGKIIYSVINNSLQSNFLSLSNLIYSLGQIIIITIILSTLLIYWSKKAIYQIEVK